MRFALGADRADAYQPTIYNCLVDLTFLASCSPDLLDTLSAIPDEILSTALVAAAYGIAERRFPGTLLYAGEPLTNGPLLIPRALSLAGIRPSSPWSFGIC
mmetsp:Transcript_68231/g.168604  ORF Transcript_68231/g.168604 Transcript_68231/m.168604 type:complete len:101 (+) Transcript_68231:1108-1410(+)